MPTRNLESPFYYDESGNMIVVSSASLNFTQEDMFEIIDLSNWHIVDRQPCDSGSYNITFSTSSALENDNHIFQNIKIDPLLAKKIINSGQFEVIKNGDETAKKLKNFESKNNNNIKVII